MHRCPKIFSGSILLKASSPHVVPMHTGTYSRALHVTRCNCRVTAFMNVLTLRTSLMGVELVCEEVLCWSFQHLKCVPVRWSLHRLRCVTVRSSLLYPVVAMQDDRQVAPVPPRFGDIPLATRRTRPPTHSDEIRAVFQSSSAPHSIHKELRPGKWCPKERAAIGVLKDARRDSEAERLQHRRNYDSHHLVGE